MHYRRVRPAESTEAERKGRCAILPLTEPTVPRNLARRYMLLENYPYYRTRMMVLNMAHTGAFGEVTYGESSYIHDTWELACEKDGSLSRRGQLVRTSFAAKGRTAHSLASVSASPGSVLLDQIARIEQVQGRVITLRPLLPLLEMHSREIADLAKHAIPHGSRQVLVRKAD